MIPRRYQVFLWVVPMVALGWLLSALLEPDPGGRMFEYVGLGFLFGTYFGQTTLASAWTALGPLPLVWRLPLSLTWVVLLAVALAINLSLHGGPREAVAVVGCCLLGQWLLVQVPLWGLAMGYRLRLRHSDDADLDADPREQQFGIRQLMIITTLVGVAFGIGRAVVIYLGVTFNPTGGEAPIFIFLAVAAIVLTLPLLLAALLPRLAWLATLIVLILIGLATAWEVPLLRGFHRGPGPHVGHIIWINVFTAAWILAVAAIARLSGYRLATPGWGLPVNAKSR